jgi:hypothetical protein
VRAFKIKGLRWKRREWTVFLIAVQLIDICLPSLCLLPPLDFVFNEAVAFWHVLFSVMTGKMSRDSGEGYISLLGIYFLRMERACHKRAECAKQIKI